MTGGSDPSIREASEFDPAAPTRSGILDLFIRPGRFFRDRASRMSLWFLLLAAWIAGILRADENMEQMFMKRPEMAFSGSWSSYVLVIGVLGFLAGLLIYLIMGWWFRARLFFCGVRAAHKRTARAIYLTSRLVACIGAVVLLIWEAVTFDTPVDAWATATISHVALGALVMLFLIWSVVISWRGVRAVFPSAGRVRAAIFFLVLPLLLYIGAFAIVFAAGLLGRLPDQPILTNPARFESCGFRFDFPRNWRLDLEHEDHDRNFFLIFEEPNGGYVSFEIMELDEPIAHIAEAHWDQLDFPDDKTRMGATGAYSGIGWQGVENDLHYGLQVSQLTDGWVLEVKFCTTVHAWDAVKSGVELMTRSLQALPGPRQLPDLKQTRSIAFGPILLQAPSNWAWSDADDVLEIWSGTFSFWVYHYPREGSLEDEIVVTSANTLDDAAMEEAYEAIDHWGPLPGYGRTYEVTKDDQRWRFLFFAAEHGPDSVLEFGIAYDPEMEALIKPGLELIKSSMSVEPPEQDGAVP